MENNVNQSFLKYNFLIDTGIWNSVYDFENWLEKALENSGAQGHILNPIKGYNGFEKVVHITKTPPPPIPTPPTTTNNSVASQKLKDIAGDSPNVKPVGKINTSVIKAPERLTVPQMRFKRGRFMQRKGYLQRKP